MVSVRWFLFNRQDFIVEGMVFVQRIEFERHLNRCKETFKTLFKYLGMMKGILSIPVKRSWVFSIIMSFLITSLLCLF